MRGLWAIILACVALAGCAADIPYDKLEAKYANAQSHYMDLPGGVRVNYRDQGKRDGCHCSQHSAYHSLPRAHDFSSRVSSRDRTRRVVGYLRVAPRR